MSLPDDLKLAFRHMWRAPIPAAGTVLILALGIVATTGLFAIVDGLFLRPLPFSHPEQLAAVSEWMDVSRRLHSDDLALETQRLDASTAIESRCSGYIATFAESRNLADVGDINHAIVSWNFFSVLGAQPMIGRAFTAEDVGANPTPAVISAATWRARFGDDRSVIGQAQDLDGDRMVIIGVMRPTFEFPKGAGVWTPSALSATYPVGYVRIATNTTVGQVASNFRRLNIRPIAAEARPPGSTALSMLFAAALLILMIAWVQVGALQVAALVGRAREIATRLALGATRGKICRQVAVEAILLALLATAAAWITLPAVIVTATRYLPPEMTIGHHPVVDARTLIFACAAAVLGASMLVILAYHGVATLISAASLRTAADHSIVAATSRLRAGLLIAQVAFTTVLVYLTGLAAATLMNLDAVDLGLQPSNVLVLATPSRKALVQQRRKDKTAQERTPTQKGLREEDVPRFGSPDRVVRLSDTYAAVSRIPGVRDVAGGLVSPLEPGGAAGTARILGNVGFVPLTVRVNDVTPNYFAVIGARMLAGRSFDQRREDEAIVNEAMAMQMRAAGSRVLGDTVQVTAQRGTVVGIVKNSLLRPDAPAEPEVFFRDWAGLSTRIFVRVDRDRAAAAAVRRAAAQMWGMPDVRTSTLKTYFLATTAAYRGRATLLAGLAFVGLGLAGLGILGSLAFVLRQRTREIAVRLALGASEAGVRRKIVQWIGAPLLSGFAVGVVCAVLIGRSTQSLLFGVSYIDVRTTLLTTTVVVLLTAVVTAFPARRAARIDPAVALRES